MEEGQAFEQESDSSEEEIVVSIYINIAYGTSASIYVADTNILYNSHSHIQICSLACQWKVRLESYDHRIILPEVWTQVETVRL